MLLTNPHQTPHSHDRRIYNPQLSVAGEEGAAAQQEGYGASYLSYKLNLVASSQHHFTSSHTRTDFQCALYQPTLAALKVFITNTHPVTLGRDWRRIFYMTQYYDTLIK